MSLFDERTDGSAFDSLPPEELPPRPTPAAPARHVPPEERDPRRPSPAHAVLPAMLVAHGGREFFVGAISEDGFCVGEPVRMQPQAITFGACVEMLALPPERQVLSVEWYIDFNGWGLWRRACVVRVSGNARPAGLKRGTGRPHLNDKQRREAERARERAEQLAESLLDGAESFRPYAGRLSRYFRKGAPPPAAPKLDDTAPVNVCPCCSRIFTARTWAELPLLGVKEHLSGQWAVHEEFRNCSCGSTRMLVSKSLATELQLRTLTQEGES